MNNPLLRNVAIAVAVGIVVGLILGLLSGAGFALPGGPTVGVGVAIGLTFAILHLRTARS
ncbi:MAG TPA: hypothetical protein VD886_25335 [Herpetosiphonaceae bacterium]|nr:hypothetical protein [Herpetosiphonaceae bacterium]